MLNKEQGRGYGYVLGFESDNMTIEESLQIIVAMVFQALLGKDGLYIGKGLESTATGFIVYHTYLFFPVGGCNAIQTVDHTTKCSSDGVVAGGYLVIHSNGLFES